MEYMYTLVKRTASKLVKTCAGGCLWTMLALPVWAGKANVLMVTAADNIKSNHYYDDYIAREMGVKVDSLDYYFNGAVTRHLQSLHDSELEYVLLPEGEQAAVKGDIEVSGEAESSVASVDKMSMETYHALLEKNHSRFLLVINQHYLKKMESGTMNTVFHIVSYTLFDEDKKPVSSSSLYYSTIKLEKPQKMESQLKKTAAKIASRVEKLIF